MNETVYTSSWNKLRLNKTVYTSSWFIFCWSKIYI